MTTVADLFHLRNGHGLGLNQLKRARPPDGVNFVARSRWRNGVTARVHAPSTIAMGEAGELTVALSGRSGGVLSTFVQPERFITGFHVMILTPRDPQMTLAEKLWWARCIYANYYRYNFGRQANRSLAKLVLPSVVPDFVKATSVPELHDAHAPLGREAQIAPTSSWGRWPLGDLFDIRKGKRLISRERARGATPFVTTSTQHNGIVEYINVEPMFPAGCITVPYNGEGGVGYAFFQPAAFCASDDVQVLVPPDGVDRAALMFVCTVIRGERYRYSFGRKWHLTRMKETPIRLPALPSGEPDWTAMSTYMKGLAFSTGALG
jgi:Type I restriction modification DNA specificity domain